MPKTFFLTNEHATSGVDVTWTPTANRLEIGGWYDSFVGIEGKAMTLGEFFEALGITEAHVRRAFRQHKERRT